MARRFKIVLIDHIIEAVLNCRELSCIINLRFRGKIISIIFSNNQASLIEYCLSILRGLFSNLSIELKVSVSISLVPEGTIFPYKHHQRNLKMLFLWGLRYWTSMMHCIFLHASESWFLSKQKWRLFLVLVCLIVYRYNAFLILIKKCTTKKTFFLKSLCIDG